MAEKGLRRRLAKQVGITPTYMWMVAHGTVPAPQTAAAISAATSGAVTIAELLFPAGLPDGACFAREAQDKIA